MPSILVVPQSIDPILPDRSMMDQKGVYSHEVKNMLSSNWIFKQTKKPHKFKLVDGLGHEN